MTHDAAWDALPDLATGAADKGILAHVRTCHACQQRLFALQRVDRLLRETRPTEARRRWRPLVVVGASLAAAAALAITLAITGSSSGHELVLRDATGAVLARGSINGGRISVTARGLPPVGGRQVALWVRTPGNTTEELGRMRPGPDGTCHATFTAPRDQRLQRVWIAPESSPGTVLAST